MLVDTMLAAQTTRPLLGKSGIVTGASRGIGRAIAVCLARAGAAVLVGFETNAAAAQDAVEQIRAEGGNATPWRLDVLEMAPPLDADFLVNNAGISQGRSVGRMSHMDWDRTLDVNLGGAFRMTQAVLPGMIERGYGRIVNISSVVGLDGRLGPTSYAASKAGLIGLTKAAALELAHKGVTVNAIAPGFIQGTGLLAQVPEPMRADVLSKIPMGRFGKPEDVAQAALYLIAYGDYVTGTVLNVSGGWLT
jgi:NAD(P)-dependent dehydrogenase (short-subunit alcohol dehydrogenase family)